MICYIVDFHASVEMGQPCESVEMEEAPIAKQRAQEQSKQ